MDQYGKGLGSEGRHLMVPEFSSGGPFSRFRNGAGRFEMRDPGGLGGYVFAPAGSPSAECSKTIFSRIKKGGHLATAQKVRACSLAYMGDGVATRNEVSAGGADSLDSLCIPW